MLPVGRMGDPQALRVKKTGVDAHRATPDAIARARMAAPMITRETV
jgi:hypothetical protein